MIEYGLKKIRLFLCVIGVSLGMLLWCGAEEDSHGEYGVVLAIDNMAEKMAGKLYPYENKLFAQMKTLAFCSHRWRVAVTCLYLFSE